MAIALRLQWCSYDPLSITWRVPEDMASESDWLGIHAVEAGGEVIWGTSGSGRGMYRKRESCTMLRKGCDMCLRRFIGVQGCWRDVEVLQGVAEEGAVECNAMYPWESPPTLAGVDHPHALDLPQWRSAQSGAPTCRGDQGSQVHPHQHCRAPARGL